MTDDTIDASSSPASASHESLQLGPIAESKRIDAMDVLRGIALIGILLMNIEWFGRSIAELGSLDHTLTGLDHAVGWLIRCLVEGKFYKLFALLFGMGFAVMLIRAREVGKPFGAWFTRRMLVLFAFGMLHMIFLWGGDILHDYAFAGLLFLGWIYLFQTKRLKRFDNPTSFLRISLVWLSVPFVLSSIAALGFSVWFDHDKLTAQWEEETHIAALVATGMESLPDDVENTVTDADATEEEGDIQSSSAEKVAESASESEDADAELSEEEVIAQTVDEIIERRQERNADIEEEITVFTQGSYWEATKFRLHHAGEMLKNTPMFSLLILMPIFLLGYWLIASGTLRNHRENRHIFKPMALIGMSFGLFFTIGGLMIIQHPMTDKSEMLQATGETLFFLGQYVLCAGYLGSIVTLLGSPSWSKRLSRFAPMGRMALTNYIMHSVILTTMFYGYAGGLYGQVSRAPQMLVVAAIIIFQVYLSAWWLGRYRFGPLEWLWRSLTYKAIQPMRIAH